MVGAGRAAAWLTVLLFAPWTVAAQGAASEHEPDMGAFRVLDTEVEGRFVSFGVDNARQSLARYTVGGREVFRSVSSVSTIPGFPLPQGDAGPAIDVGKPEGFRVHDNPSGLLVLRGPTPLGDPNAPEEHLPPVGTRFRLELAEGIEASNESRRSLVLVWGEGNRGILRSDRDFRVEGRDVFIQGSAVFLAHAPQALLPDASNVDRAVWQEGLALGHVAAVVTIVRGATGLLVETLAVRDVAVNATHDAEGDLVLKVNSTEAVPVVLALNIEDGIVPAGFEMRGFDPSNMSIEFPVRRAETLEDAMDATDDGLLLEHRPVEAADGLHVLVSVPLLSPLVLEFGPAPPATSFRETLERPVVIAGVVAALLAVGVAVVTFFRRPSDRQMG